LLPPNLHPQLGHRNVRKLTAVAKQNAATANAQPREIAIKVFHSGLLELLETRTPITTTNKRGAAAAANQYVFSRSNLLSSRT
jgi:chromosomal replication initiation ATPase DnaA